MQRGDDEKKPGDKKRGDRKKQHLQPNEFLLSQATEKDLDRRLSVKQRELLQEHLEQQKKLAAVSAARQRLLNRQEFRCGQKVYIKTPIPGKGIKIQTGFVSCVNGLSGEITVTYYNEGMIQLVEGQKIETETFTVPEGRTMFGKFLPDGCFKSISVLE